ncbi:MAG: hypothetical protein ACRD2A_23660, partial [Vicinamibacterales bacterium]
MKSSIALRFVLATALTSGVALAPTVADLLTESRPYAVLPVDTFNAMGAELPDGGRTVKAIADAAPGGAFDPRKLESATGLGYRARWHVVRYRYYGLDWDITG